jgi:hypothetical protein
MDGEADQAISLHFGARQLASIVAAVQCYHWTGCLGGLERACRPDLLDSHRGGRSSLSITTGHIQRQYPAPVLLGHCDQPLIGPGGHEVML